MKTHLLCLTLSILAAAPITANANLCTVDKIKAHEDGIAVYFKADEGELSVRRLDGSEEFFEASTSGFTLRKADSDVKTKVEFLVLKPTEGASMSGLHSYCGVEAVQKDGRSSIRAYDRVFLPGLDDRQNEQFIFLK